MFLFPLKSSGRVNCLLSVTVFLLFFLSVVCLSVFGQELTFQLNLELPLLLPASPAQELHVSPCMLVTPLEQNP